MKKIALMLVAVLIMQINSFTVMAAQTNVSVSYNSSSELVTLSGDATGLTTIRVTLSGTDYAALSDANHPVDVDQIISNGTLSYDFYLPSDAAKGKKYIITVTDDFGTDNDSFIFFNADEAELILAKAEKEATKAKFVEYLTSDNNLFKLGLDADDEHFSTYVLETMYDLYDDYVDVEDFRGKYGFCLAVCSLKGKNISETETILKDNSSVLGINYQNDYKNNVILSGASKSELCSLLSAMNYAQAYYQAKTLTQKSGFSAVLEAMSALASVNVSGGWKEIEQIYTKSFPFLQSNVVSKNADYANTTSYDVFTAMTLMSFQTPADLKNNFDKAVTDSQPSSINKPSANKPSTGGSMSFPTGSASTPSGTEVYEEIPVEALPSESVISHKIPSLDVEGVNFPDVSEAAWYYSVVSALGGANIISGDETGKFRPEASITRAEFAKLVVCAFSLKASDSKGSVSNLPSDAWYTPYIKIAAAVGIMQGDESGDFRPLDNISRQDAAVIIYRVADSIGKQYIGFKDFNDRDNISLYAWSAVGALYQNGIISGMGDGCFSPHSNITRAEAAQILYNCLNSMTSKK